ncbi:MAG: hypothetical protein QXX17_03170 [Conexivisphaerales archaeon]
MAEKALQLDPTTPSAHAVLGLLLCNDDFEFLRAKEELQNALRYNQSDSRARTLYAKILALYHDLDGVLEQLEIAEAHDPLNPGVLTWKSVILWIMGKREMAMKAFDAAVELDPSPLGSFNKLIYLLNDGRIDDALVKISKLSSRVVNEPLLKMLWGYIQAKRGNKEQAIKILERLKSLCERSFASEDHVAIVYAGLGEIEESFEWWRKGVRKHSIEPLYMVYPTKTYLRENWNEERWRELRLEAGLE